VAQCGTAGHRCRRAGGADGPCVCVKVTHPLSDGTSSGALPLPAGVHHLLDPDRLALLSIPTQGRRERDEPEVKAFSVVVVILVCLQND